MSEQAPLVFVNGLAGATVSPLDRGLAYGDGLFETVQLLAGRLPLWPLHCERLEEGARRLAIPLDKSTLVKRVDQVLAEVARTESGNGILKIILTRGCGGRGYGLPEQPEPTLCLIFYPAGEATETSQGLRVRVCQQRLSPNPTLAGLKHLNRLEQVLARAEWEDPRIAEGLLLDREGLIVEATASNLFVVLNSRLLTPDLTQTGVAGVARRLILERLAPALGLSAEVGALTLEQLQMADEVFLCNSVRGIRPVYALGEQTAPQWPAGSITGALQAEWARLMVRGLD